MQSERNVHSKNGGGKNKRKIRYLYSAESRLRLLFVLHLRQNIKISTSLYFHFSWFIITYDLSCLYSSDNSFGSRVFWNFTIEGNENSSVQELGCLIEAKCSLDKSLFHAAVNLIHVWLHKKIWRKH